mgnify:CR=1 FL=1
MKSKNLLIAVMSAFVFVNASFVEAKSSSSSSSSSSSRSSSYSSSSSKSSSSSSSWSSFSGSKSSSSSTASKPAESSKSASNTTSNSSSSQKSSGGWGTFSSKNDSSVQKVEPSKTATEMSAASQKQNSSNIYKQAVIGGAAGAAVGAATSHSSNSVSDSVASNNTGSSNSGTNSVVNKGSTPVYSSANSHRYSESYTPAPSVPIVVTQPVYVPHSTYTPSYNNGAPMVVSGSNTASQSQDNGFLTFIIVLLVLGGVCFIGYMIYSYIERNSSIKPANSQKTKYEL